MIKVKLCVFAVVVGLTGAVWAGQAGAAEKIGRPEVAVTVGGKNSGSQIKVTGSQMTCHGDFITTTDGRLSTGDGVLDASAKKMSIDTKKIVGQEAAAVIMEDGAKVSISLKNGSKVFATARKGQIDWGTSLVKLQGDVVVTSTQPGVPGSSKVKADSVTISWTEKLGEGKIRVEIKPAAK